MHTADPINILIDNLRAAFNAIEKFLLLGLMQRGLLAAGVMGSRFYRASRNNFRRGRQEASTRTAAKRRYTTMTLLIPRRSL